MEIKRDKYLKMLEIRKNNGLVKVITGIRRCGKSYLLNEIFYNNLITQGIKEDHIIRFAFDSANDLALLGIDIQQFISSKIKVDPQIFLAYISKKIQDADTYYLLLDEVQNLDCFESVLNGYLRKKNIDIYVTGSNSKFLSSDVITEFAGRGDEIYVLPLSFSEFYSTRNEDDKEYALDDYLTYGGLHAIALMKDSEQKTNYLKTQLKNVYLQDIITRNNLSSDKDIGELLDVIASGISSLTNPAKLERIFKSMKNSSLSASTIDKYISYMKDSFLLSKARRYDVKGKNYIATPYKIYFEDLGLRNARLDFRQIEENHLMENAIYNELRYRGYNVDVGVVEIRENISGTSKRKELEVDFVANLASKRYYLQSAYDISNEDKLKQETNSFDKISDSFKKIIIVGKTMKPRYSEKGYLFVGIKDFLLNPNSLEF